MTLYVPVITPFAEDGSLAVDALRLLAAQLLESGATGLVALGTTGEPSALTAAERGTVVEVVAATCREHGAALLIGAGDAPALARLTAAGPRVTGALCLVPPFVRAGEEGVLAHLTALAAASPVPLVVYHVPARTAQPLSLTALRRLAEIPGIIGLKYAPGALTGDDALFLTDPPQGFEILAGDDVLLPAMLALGAQGAIAASAHVGTPSFAALITAWRDGDVTRARDLGRDLAALAAALFAEPNPAVIKGVLHAQGRIPTPYVRLPLLRASDRNVRTALQLSSL